MPGILSNIHLFKNLIPEEFSKLVYNARWIVGNSSVAVREYSFLGVPAMNIGGGRQAGRERGRNVVDTEYSYAQIKKAIRVQLETVCFPSAPIYGDGQAGRRIGCTMVWRAL